MFATLTRELLELVATEKGRGDASYAVAALMSCCCCCSCKAPSDQ